MTLRLGLIGCGFIGSLHSRSLRALIAAGLVDAGVVAVCDHDEERAAAFARPHGASLATTDAGAVVEAVDAVWICTPTASHLRLVEQAAAAGTAVFCEKPLAPTLAEATDLVEAVGAAGIAAQVGLVLRTAPAYRAVADLVAGGELGPPLAAVLRDDQYFPIQGRYASRWRADPAQAGGGTLIEHSIHDVDVLAWVLGAVRSVGAVTAHRAGERVEDVAVATLTHDGGATSSLVSVWHQVLTRPSTRRLEVLCERGIVVAEHEHVGPVTVTTDDGVRTLPCPAPPWAADLPASDFWRPYLAEYAPQSLAFLEALGAGRAPSPGLDVALAAHRVVDAGYRSAAAGGAPMDVA